MFANTIFAAAVACGLLASSVNAHMVIRSPIPYGQDSLNNSPLEADGSDFPCKQRSGVYDVTKMNSMPVGVPQELAFKGGATHGGGSCQVSITSDTEPTKDSKWKVIHSIIGGCPSNSTGNLSGNPDGTDSSVFQFSIPQGVPNGKYALAWTWFNKIGNREMYMNCAPIEVTGGSSKRDTSGMDDLPDMFVANIGNGCTVGESQDFVFPQCGKYAETAESTALGSSTSGTCATAAAGGSGSGSGSGSAASPTASSGSGSGSGSGASPPSYGSSSAAAAPSAPGYGGGSGAAPTSASAPSYGGAASSAAGAPAYSSPAEQGSGSGASGSGSGGGGMVIVTTWQTVTATGASPAAAQPTGYSGGSDAGSASGSSSGAAAGGDSTSASSTGSCSAGAQACSNDGEVVCIGSDQWGLCNAGCAVPKALAGGTSCSNGVIAKRDVSSHLKRHLYHGRKF